MSPLETLKFADQLCAVYVIPTSHLRVLLLTRHVQRHGLPSSVSWMLNNWAK
jgi:hypothetical protein